MNPGSPPPPKTNLPMRKRNANEQRLSDSEPSSHGNGRYASGSGTSADGSWSDLRGSSGASFRSGDFVNHQRVYPGLLPTLQIPARFPDLQPALVVPPPLLRANVSVPYSGQQFLQPEYQVRQDGCWPGLPSYYNQQSLGAQPLKWVPYPGESSTSQNSSASFASEWSGGPRATFPDMQPNTLPYANVFRVNNELNIPRPAFHSTGTHTPILGHVSGSRVPAAGSATKPSQQSESSRQINHVKSLQEASKEYAILSSELSNLDRYMAMHNWKLTRHAKKPLIEQRINLVRDLDAVRSFKEELEEGISQSQHDVPAAPGAASIEFLGTSGQFMDSGKPNFPVLQMGFPSSLDQSSCPPFVIYQPTLTDAPPEPALDGVSGAAFPWKVRKGIHFDTSMGPASACAATSNDNMHATDMPLSLSPNMQVPATGSTEGEGSVRNSGIWETPKKTSPHVHRIHRIYRQIADAMDSGASIESLVQELAAVTVRSDSRLNNESGNSPGSRPVRMSRPRAVSDSHVSQGSSAPNEARYCLNSRNVRNRLGETAGVSQLWGSLGSEQAYGNRLRGSSHVSSNSLGTVPDDEYVAGAVHVILGNVY